MRRRQDDSGRPRPDERPLLVKILREPLLHFVLIGAALYLSWHSLDSRRYVITVGPQDIKRIVATYQQQFGTAPEPGQVRALVDARIREEIYLREGLALGLERNDEIVRRRIAQKFAFLQNDRAVPPEPSEQELKSWFQTHRAAYRTPATRSFEQRYFAIDHRGESGARAAAEAALGRLGDALDVAADSFPGPASVEALTRDEVDRLFGGEGFAGAVFKAPAGQWSGPFRSGFGWHVVRVRKETPARDEPFAAVRDRVRADLLAAEQAADDRRAYQALLARYRINRADTKL